MQDKLLDRWLWGMVGAAILCAILAYLVDKQRPEQASETVYGSTGIWLP